MDGLYVEELIRGSWWYYTEAVQESFFISFLSLLLVFFLMKWFPQLRTQNEIIVMELCSGGSLFTMLENPTNAYGFQEEEFKQVVKDVG